MALPVVPGKVAKKDRNVIVVNTNSDAPWKALEKKGLITLRNALWKARYH